MHLILKASTPLEVNQVLLTCWLNRIRISVEGPRPLDATVLLQVAGTETISTPMKAGGAPGTPRCTPDQAVAKLLSHAGALYSSAFMHAKEKHLWAQHLTIIPCVPWYPSHPSSTLSSVLANNHCNADDLSYGSIGKHCFSSAPSPFSAERVGSSSGSKNMLHETSSSSLGDSGRQSSSATIFTSNKFEITAHYNYTALGGTFDRLHLGHKLLLTAALLHTRSKIRIGVTGPVLLAGKTNAHLLQPFEVRVQAVKNFCEQIRADVELEIVELTEYSGGTERIPEVEALIISPETAHTVEKINAARVSHGLLPLVGVAISFVGGDDNTSRLSSTELRGAEVARTQNNSSSTPGENKK